MTLDVKKSNSSNVTPNVMTVGVENYGLNELIFAASVTYLGIMHKLASCNQY
jgi:hypothetical protein